MAKINFNSAALYIDGKKVPGVTDIQFDGAKDSVIWEYKNGPSKNDPNVYLDFEYDFIKSLVIFECKYQGKKTGYQLKVQSLLQTYDKKNLLNHALQELLSYLMVPENTPIKLGHGYIGSGLADVIKEWSMQFDTVSYNTQAIIGSASPKETTASLSKQLPGIHSVVACPAKCKDNNDVVWEQTLWHMIQHLNDRHRWSRERIADFLDELPEEIDITFKTKELQ